MLLAPAGFSSSRLSWNRLAGQDASVAPPYVHEAVLRHRPVFRSDGGLDPQVGLASSLAPSVTRYELAESRGEVPQGCVQGPVSFQRPSSLIFSQTITSLMTLADKCFCQSRKNSGDSWKKEWWNYYNLRLDVRLDVEKPSQTSWGTRVFAYPLNISSCPYKVPTQIFYSAHFSFRLRHCCKSEFELVMPCFSFHAAEGKWTFLCFFFHYFYIKVLMWTKCIYW